MQAEVEAVVGVALGLGGKVGRCLEEAGQTT